MKKIKLIALLAAAVAGLCIYAFLREISKPQETPRTSVVVAAVDIPENTKITAEMVMLQPVADESLLPGHMLELESVVDSVLSSDVYAGEQILRERLVQVGAEVDESKTLAYKIDDGMRAITIPVDAASGLSNMIKPGNRVDIIMSYSRPDGWGESYKTSLTEKKPAEEPEPAEGEGTEEAGPYAEELYSRVEFQNLTVLAVDAELTKAGLEAYSTVTLQVTPEMAVEIAQAEWMNLQNQTNQRVALRLVLRSPLDEEILETADVYMDTLLGLEEEGEK